LISSVIQAGRPVLPATCLRNFIKHSRALTRFASIRASASPAIAARSFTRSPSRELRSARAAVAHNAATAATSSGTRRRINSAQSSNAMSSGSASDAMSSWSQRVRSGITAEIESNCVAWRQQSSSGPIASCAGVTAVEVARSGRVMRLSRMSQADKITATEAAPRVGQRESSATFPNMQKAAAPAVVTTISRVIHSAAHRAILTTSATIVTTSSTNPSSPARQSNRIIIRASARDTTDPVGYNWQPLDKIALRGMVTLLVKKASR
jgi:hypothetical protein